MSSGFSGGAPEFLFSAGINGRSITLNNPQAPYRSQLAGILADPSSQIFQRRSDLIGKRSLAEFQAQQQNHLFQQQQRQNHLFQQQQQQQQGLGRYLRNVKPRTYQQVSPISPLSPVDFSASISPENTPTTISSSPVSTGYGIPILQQIRQQPVHFSTGNGLIPSSNANFSTLSYPNWVQNRVVNQEALGQESEKKMMNNKLQELEKQLLDDNDDEEGDGVSVITNSEWSETIQNLISPSQKPISPSPTSSSSSCSSTSASPAMICSNQSLIEAASAISEGKSVLAVEILTRLNQVSNVKGTSEQRLTAYMASALRSRVNPLDHPPPVSELFSKENNLSTQMLHEFSPCFKLGFMAANLAILEAISNLKLYKLHVVDFDVGQGRQYVHLLHALAGRRADKPISLKLTTFKDFTRDGEERLKMVEDNLNSVANDVGVRFNFNVLGLKICDLGLDTLGSEIDEALAVNFAYRLYKLPDESVTTDNLRDELLRRVKGLSPAVVTVVEQEMNANTAPFLLRVKEACGYYGALFDSLEATFRDNPERVRIEEGLGRKAANSVACEGRDRVERCEVFGKWRARMGMAGFGAKPLSQHVAESLRAKLNSGSRGNPGFTLKEETGGICFGWMGRTLTVASAWH